MCDTMVKHKEAAMFRTYPAIFYPEPDGRYSVIFPDLNDLATYGDNLTDAIEMARKACEQYIRTCLQDGEELPVATAIENVAKDDDNAFVMAIEAREAEQ